MDLQWQSREDTSVKKQGQRHDLARAFVKNETGGNNERIQGRMAGWISGTHRLPGPLSAPAGDH